MPRARINVTNHQNWGRLVKTWATGRNYVDHQPSEDTPNPSLVEGPLKYPKPTSFEDFVGQCKKAQVGLFFQDDVDNPAGLLHTSIWKVPRPAGHEGQENDAPRRARRRVHHQHLRLNIRGSASPGAEVDTVSGSASGGQARGQALPIGPDSDRKYVQQPPHHLLARRRLRPEPIGSDLFQSSVESSPCLLITTKVGKCRACPDRKAWGCFKSLSRRFHAPLIIGAEKIDCRAVGHLRWPGHKGEVEGRRGERFRAPIIAAIRKNLA